MEETFTNRILEHLEWRNSYVSRLMSQIKRHEQAASFYSSELAKWTSQDWLTDNLLKMFDKEVAYDKAKNRTT